MKKSTRLLGICVGYYFAVAVCLIVTLRLLYVYRPYGTADGKPSNSPQGARSDSSRAMGPGTSVPWYRITLGLRKAGLQDANDSLCIFKEIPLHYLSHSHDHTITVNFTGPERFRPSRGLSFLFRVDTHYPGQWSDWGRHIRVMIIQKYDANRKDDLYDIRKKLHPTQDGITKYWSNESATSEWAGRGWYSHIQVPLAACEGDSMKTRALADRICDRMLKYYATLN